jgi:hypothetical protein
MKQCYRLRKHPHTVHTLPHHMARRMSTSAPRVPLPAVSRGKHASGSRKTGSALHRQALLRGPRRSPGLHASDFAEPDPSTNARVSPIRCTKWDSYQGLRVLEHRHQPIHAFRQRTVNTQERAKRCAPTPATRQHTYCSTQFQRIAVVARTQVGKSIFLKYALNCSVPSTRATNGVIQAKY